MNPRTNQDLIDLDEVSSRRMDVLSLRPVLLEYWSVVMRWRWLILAVSLIGLGLATFITLSLPKQYTATTLVQIDREQKRVTNVEGIDPDSASRDAEFYATQYELLKARSLAERVARVLKLDKNKAFFEAHGANQKLQATAVRTSAQDLDWAVDLLLANVAITPIRNSRLVTIGYTSQDPAMGAQIANAWAKQFIGANLDRQFAATTEARRFLEGRLDVLRKRLEESERAATSFASGEDIVQVDEARDGTGASQGGRSLVATELASVNQRLLEASAARLEAQTAMRAAITDADDAALASPVITGLRQRRADLAVDYAKLLVQFDPEYGAAKRVKSQIDTLDRLIRDEIKRINDARTQRYQTALAKERELQSQLASLKTKLQSERNSAIQYNIYIRDADTNRQLYEAILQRYKEIGVAAGVGVNNIAIIDPAEVPQSPSSPKLANNLAIGLIAGIGLAVLLIVILEQIDQGVRNPAQMEMALELPVIGAIPAQKGTEAEVWAELVDAKSEIYEAYFSIYSNLSLATAHGFPRSLMVTSAVEKEGKSSSVVALALIMARLGRKVMVIDADLRSPSIHWAFSLSRDDGLANYLAGQDDWHALVKKTGQQNLTVMAAGPLPPNSPELLSGERLKALVAQALQEFDVVLVDAPPVLGLADAALISQAVEGSLFVVEAKRVPMQRLKDSIERLQLVRARLLGGVLVKVPRQNNGYGYGYGYGYGSKYGQAPVKQERFAWLKKIFGRSS